MSEKDLIYIEKKKALKSTLAFLKALKKHLPNELAIEVSKTAAANFMISIYEEVFEGTVPESQERFDKFREFYENHPKTSPYCEILESSKQLLKVVFHRCPHIEILKNEDLFEFAESSCLSDIAFTERLLPGVKFTRESSIREGNEGCIMKWEKLN